MTWRNVGRPIARFNRDRRSSLKGGGYVAHYYSSVNCFKYDIISAVNEESYNAEIKTDENASGALDQDQTDDIFSIISKARDVALSHASISDLTVTT